MQQNGLIQKNAAFWPTTNLFPTPSTIKHLASLLKKRKFVT